MNKILILILSFLSTLTVKTPDTWAIGFTSDIRDDARDMLRSETEENENADSASRWGQSIRNRNRQEHQRVTHTDPILDTSFAQETHTSGRAPASVTGNRGPAAMPEQQPPHASTQNTPPHAAVIRAVNKQKAYQESAVIASDQGFFPSTVFVTQGIPVRLFVTGASAKSQCFIMDSFGVRRQIKSQKIEEISFTPETSGTYTFTCPMNGARGQIVVREIDLGGRLPASESNDTRDQREQQVSQNNHD
jgi:plastocyanin